MEGGREGVGGRQCTLVAIESAVKCYLKMDHLVADSQYFGWLMGECVPSWYCALGQRLLLTDFCRSTGSIECESIICIAV